VILEALSPLSKLLNLGAPQELSTIITALMLNERDTDSTISFFLQLVRQLWRVTCGLEGAFIFDFLLSSTLKSLLMSE